MVQECSSNTAENHCLGKTVFGLDVLSHDLCFGSSNILFDNRR